MSFIYIINDPEISRNIEENNVNLKSEKTETMHEIRSIASQCFVALALNILRFSCGNFVGFTNVFLGQKPNIFDSMTIYQMTIFSYYCFTQSVGLIIGGVFAQYVGARQVILISSFILTCGWLLFFWVSKVSMLLFLQGVIGLTMGMCTGPSYAYLSEISQPNLRSILITTLSLSFLLGDIYTKYLGSHMHWDELPLKNLIFPLTGCGMIYFLPESPYWLANYKMDEAVESSLMWFRGWTSFVNIETENASICNSRTAFCNNIEKVISKSFIGGACISCLKISLNRSILIPLKFIWHICLIAVYSGSYALINYHDILLTEINSPLNKTTVFTAVQIIQIFGIIMCTFSVRYFGKKKLALISLIGTSISLILASIISSIISKYKITQECHHAVFLSTILMAIFMSHAGINNIVLIMIAEVFPSKVRQIGIGLVFLEIHSSTKTFHWFFHSLLKIITVPGTCFMFALIGIGGFSILYRTLFETENKSLVEIEEYFLKINKFNSKDQYPELQTTNL